MSVPVPEAPPVVPEVPPTDPPKPTPPEPDKAPKDWEKEATSWKALSRKHEDAEKANADKARQFDALQEASKTELQKVADKATKAEAEAATTRGELALMRAAVKHGLTADDLELLGTHGTTEEIEARAEKLAARLKTVAANKPPVDFGGGDRGGDVGGKGKQYTRTDLKSMTPHQIEEARAAGSLDQILSGKTP